jgi:hypothetical protein
MKHIAEQLSLTPNDDAFSGWELQQKSEMKEHGAD